jgi:hypothetical protein
LGKFEPLLFDLIDPFLVLFNFDRVEFMYSSGRYLSGIGLEHNGPRCSTQTSIACSAPSEKREGAFLHGRIA